MALNRETERNRAESAARLAEELVADLGLTSAPIDPLAIAEGERPLLIAKGGNLGGLFDGQLEYHSRKGRFVLFFNTKYDRGDERHHPRTRFSVAHELGHFYIPEHRAFLQRGGASHQSRGEFSVDSSIEREADAFAAGLLLPLRLLAPRIRGRELTTRLLDQIAGDFEASRVATAIRCVQATDSPCGVFGVRDGHIVWKRVSEMAVRAGCYPRKDERLRSKSAVEQWAAFSRGETRATEKETSLGNWFETYDRDHLDRVVVTEQYLPILVMGTLLVIVTMDEGDLFEQDDED